MGWYEEMLEEHLVILGVVDSLKRYAKALEEGKSPPKELLDGALFLIRNFADRCHHGKEENVLFPLIRKKTAEHGTMVDTLLAEHAQGRDFARMMASEKQDDVLKGSHGYCDLLIKHIVKENRFFRDCDSLMTPSERGGLEEGFERVEEEVVGKGEHERYHQMAKKLSEAAKKL